MEVSSYRLMQRDKLDSGYGHIAQFHEKRLHEHHKLVAEDRQKGVDKLRKLVPLSVLRPSDVAAIANLLHEPEGEDNRRIDDWLIDEDVREVTPRGEDTTDPQSFHHAFNKLRLWPEFQTLATAVYDLRWTTKPIGRQDLMSCTPLLGRVKVVPAPERMTWVGETSAPDFRLEISLPYVLIATFEQLERGIHDLLCTCGFVNKKPVLRKPDIIANAATLGRYGVQDIREANAVFHAQRHPMNLTVQRSFGFDASSGQGQLWTAGPPKQIAGVVVANPAMTRSRPANVIPIPEPDVSADIPEDMLDLVLTSVGKKQGAVIAILSGLNGAMGNKALLEQLPAVVASGISRKVALEKISALRALGADVSGVPAASSTKPTIHPAGQAVN